MLTLMKTSDSLAGRGDGGRRFADILALTEALGEIEEE